MVTALALGLATLLNAPIDRAATMRAREADWRIGPVVYHAFVDRFAPSGSLEAKRSQYSSPRRLMAWSDKPVGGRQLPEVGVWSHELDFWGGDLPSLRGKIDHVALLADVLYLNPIHSALTNHKYDATDFNAVAPEYGTWDDFRGLVADLKSRKMRLVLDGVFNHLGKSNQIFREAQRDANSKYRSWFAMGKEYPLGYRAWANVPNLPEIHLENRAARDYLWLGKESVVARWLREGADGWRLDVAHEIGPEYLAELTAAAHAHKPGSLVVGEVWNYPTLWTKALDGVLNMHLGRVIIDTANGGLTARQTSEAIGDLVADCGIEPLLRSWVVLGNHDTDRLASVLKAPETRRFAQALQFALPGAPLIYYGDEIAMEGSGDPGQRAPMEWSRVSDSNADLAFVRKLVQIRKSVRALRIGDCRPLRSEHAVAFLRTTEKALESTIVLANPSDRPVTESWVVPDSTIMGYTLFRDLLSNVKERVHAGTLKMTIPPKTVRIMVVDEEAVPRGQYKRMKDGD